MPGRVLFRETLAALMVPRRPLPIALVCAPLVAAQGRFSGDPMAVPLAIAMCVAFVLVAPTSWRWLVPDRAAAGATVLRVTVCAAVAAVVVLGLGVAVPELFGIGRTFLTHPASLAITGALFVVGRWGLGRDIGLEASLARERARADSLAREAEQAQLLAWPSPPATASCWSTRRRSVTRSSTARW